MTYTARLHEVPADGKRLDVWLPVPSSDARQIISDLTIPAPIGGWHSELQTESQYGNRVLHLWTEQPAAIEVPIRFRCQRREIQTLVSPAEAADLSSPPGPRLLQPDRLGVIDARVKALAVEVTAGKADTLSQAHAIYDYVVDHMAYDKTAAGWGQGDTLAPATCERATARIFMRWFISLARAQGFPRGLRLAFPCRVWAWARSRGITAGRSFGFLRRGGCRWMLGGVESIRNAVHFILDRSTPIACR